MMRFALLLVVGAAASEVTVYKVINDECIQTPLAQELAEEAIKMLGLKEGTCSSEGFTVPDGTKELEVPFHMELALFKKPQPVADAFMAFGTRLMGAALGRAPAGHGLDSVTLYKVQGDECGQATLDKKYESPATRFAGLKEGTCSSVGYVIPEGSKDLKVPVLGEIKIELFKKAAVVSKAIEAGKSKLDEKLHAVENKLPVPVVLV